MSHDHLVVSKAFVLMYFLSNHDHHTESCDHIHRHFAVYVMSCHCHVLICITIIIVQTQFAISCTTEIFEYKRDIKMNTHFAQNLTHKNEKGVE